MEEETQRQASKDKVTILASSKGRNRNNTLFCPNAFIILNNFILWVSLGHWWAKIMKIKRLEYKVEKLWNKVFGKWQANDEVV